MASLAAAPRDVPVRAKDLSEGSGIPPHYLSKVLRRLVLADLLVSQKGQGGGFVLARSPEEIRFIEILAAVDSYPTKGRCAFGWGVCDEVNPCPLHDTWSELNDAIRDWAATTTLADVKAEAFGSRWSGRPPPVDPASSG
jgi:Rrf2 family protein